MSDVRSRWLARIFLLAGALVLAGVSRPPEAASRAADACGLPDAKPLWVEYGGGQVPVPVRKVLARPGVVIATSGTALATAYRNAGAQTVYFELKLPAYVGSPAQPADPAAITAAADRLYDLAFASTGCPTPRIALNELTNPGAATPWSPTTAAYRENVRALAQRLTERGARPALFIHGNPTFAGEAAAWWRSIGLVADVVYEAYSKGTTLDRLGRILGPRRVRLGMRSVIRKLVAAGVPSNRVGMAVGFQAKIGTFGREGLQPAANWLRVVKWQALASQQVAADEGLDSIWSWGWGVFSAEAADPDKPLAACVYLWARDPALCDALAVTAAAGTPFDRNRVEGLIVLPPRDDVRLRSREAPDRGGAPPARPARQLDAGARHRVHAAGPATEGSGCVDRRRRDRAAGDRAGVRRGGRGVPRRARAARRHTGDGPRGDRRRAPTRSRRRVDRGRGGAGNGRDLDRRRDDCGGRDGDLPRATRFPARATSRRPTSATSRRRPCWRRSRSSSTTPTPRLARSTSRPRSAAAAFCSTGRTARRPISRATSCRAALRRQARGRC